MALAFIKPCIPIINKNYRKDKEKLSIKTKRSKGFPIQIESMLHHSSQACSEVAAYFRCGGLMMRNEMLFTTAVLLIGISLGIHAKALARPNLIIK